LLCSSACGSSLDLEDRDCIGCSESINPATLACNEPLPEPLIVARGGGTETVPPVPDDAALEGMGVAEQATEAGHRLLAIDPQEDPYKVVVPEHCVPLGQEFVAVLRICVDDAGSVSGMSVLQNTLPIIDSQFPYVIARWRFQPYVMDGLPRAFCYNLRYRVR